VIFEALSLGREPGQIVLVPVFVLSKGGKRKVDLPTGCVSEEFCFGKGVREDPSCGFHCALGVGAKRDLVKPVPGQAAVTDSPPDRPGVIWGKFWSWTGTVLGERTYGSIPITCFLGEGK